MGEGNATTVALACVQGQIAEPNFLSVEHRVYSILVWYL